MMDQFIRNHFYSTIPQRVVDFRSG